MNQTVCDKNNATHELALLEAAREKIAAIDADILELIIQRQDVAAHIGALKKKLHIPVLDREREGLVLTRNCRYARQHGLSQAGVRALTKLLMEFAKKVQG